MKIKSFVPILVVAMAVGLMTIVSGGITSKAQITEVTQTGAGYSDGSDGVRHGYYVEITLNGESKKYDVYYVDNENKETLVNTYNNDKLLSKITIVLNDFAPNQSYTIRIYDDNKKYKDVVVKTAPQALAPVISSWYQNLNKCWIEFPTIASADGYQIYVENKSGKVLKKKTVEADKNSIVTQKVDIKSPTKGKIARFRVRAYMLLNGDKKFGNWSDPCYFAVPKNAKISSKEKQIKLTGLGITGATKKVVYVSTKKNSGFKKVKTLKKTKNCNISYVGKNELKSGKTYYVRVYYYYKVAGKTVKSPIVGNGSINISKYGVEAGPLTLEQSPGL